MTKKRRRGSFEKTKRSKDMSAGAKSKNQAARPKEDKKSSWASMSKNDNRA